MENPQKTMEPIHKIIGSISLSLREQLLICGAAKIEIRHYFMNGSITFKRFLPLWFNTSIGNSPSCMKMRDGFWLGLQPYFNSNSFAIVL